VHAEVVRHVPEPYGVVHLFFVQHLMFVAPAQRLLVTVPVQHPEQENN
jgi:hypothetical protein